MASKNIKLDFDPLVNYFRNLTTDMIFAWAILAVGIVALVIAVIL